MAKMVGDESPQDQAAFERRRWLQSEVKRLEFAVEAFSAQLSYAKKQVQLYEDRIDELEQELADEDLA